MTSQEKITILDVNKIVEKYLNYAFADVDWQYENLTTVEKTIMSKEEFNLLKEVYHSDNECYAKPKRETLEEVALRQLFKNRSNCYADTGRFENDGSYSEGEVIQAMDEDCFINTIKEWQQERSYSEEEVELIKNRALAYGATDSFKQWFEQFKKK